MTDRQWASIRSRASNRDMQIRTERMDLIRGVDKTLCLLSGDSPAGSQTEQTPVPRVCLPLACVCPGEFPHPPILLLENDPVLSASFYLRWSGDGDPQGWDRRYIDNSGSVYDQLHPDSWLH